MAPINVFRSLLLCICCCTQLIGKDFRVEKIEPPNWWTGMRWRRLQLCVTGENLSGVSASCASKQLRILAVRNAESPNYLLIDLELSKSIQSGEYSITLRKNEQTTQVRYPVKERTKDAQTHQGFDHRDVVYLIVPDRFSDGDAANNLASGMLPEFDRGRPEYRHGGDLQGIVQRLDYLKQLGVTTLWLTPVLENRGVNSYHGYKTTDHYKIDPRFGSNDDYRRLVKRAHAQSLKVIFDHVSNHVGIRHPWMQDLPMRDWIHGTAENHESNKHYLLSLSDPHAAANSTRMLNEFWFVDRMPDLNQRNQFLANYLIQNSLWWIEFSGIDGIREDTYPYADQRFLSRWAKSISDEYPQFNVVGEIWATQPAVIAQYQQGSPLQRGHETYLPSVMDFPLMQSLRDFVSGKGKLRDVHDIVAQDFLYANPQRLMVFMENHDTTRGAFLADDFRRIQISLGIVLTSRGIPQLLYGSEIGMKGGPRHIDLRADFPGGFPGDQRDAFTQDGRKKSENERFEFVSKLLRLRKKYPAIAIGKMIHLQPHWNQDVYTYIKITDRETILVVANGEPHECDVDLSELRNYFQAGARLRNLLNGERVPWSPGKRLKIEALQFEVFLVEP